MEFIIIFTVLALIGSVAADVVVGATPRPVVISTEATRIAKVKAKAVEERILAAEGGRELLAEEIEVLATGQRYRYAGTTRLS